MTRKEFEIIEEEQGFDSAMEELYENSDVITTYKMLKSYIIECLEDDNNMLALHILEGVYNSEGDSYWYYYDYTAGTTCTPRCLNDIDDVEAYIGFDEE